jgi:DNA-directed RNA polymerase subunit RPC12/RpoP
MTSPPSNRAIGDILNENWVPTGSHSRCPRCLSAEGIFVTFVSDDIDPDAGYWVYRCFGCGATGHAQLKTPEEKGKWIDGN